MMYFRPLVIGLVIGFAPMASFAADKDIPNKNPAVSIEKMCQQLTTHHPDGSVDYVPGKDAYWRDVVPADLDGGQKFELEYPLQIAITLDQAKQFNLLPNATYTPQMFVGMVEVRKDGSVYFNNKRLSQPQVQFLCDPNVNSVKP